jgi:hypothetical protein
VSAGGGWTASTTADSTPKDLFGWQANASADRDRLFVVAQDIFATETA